MFIEFCNKSKTRFILLFLILILPFVVSAEESGNDIKNLEKHSLPSEKSHVYTERDLEKYEPANDHFRHETNSDYQFVRISIDSADDDLQAVFHLISAAAARDGFDVSVDPTISGTADIKITNEQWPVIADMLLQKHDLDFKSSGTSFLIHRKR